MSRTIIVFACIAFVAGLHFEDPEEESRIVGGKDAEEGAFPYQVSLRKNKRHFCGGSILNEMWILTAAHCVKGQNVQNISVVAGSTTLDKGGDTYQADQLIAHANYSSEDITNDIALIKLKEPIQFNDKVKPISLMTRNLLEESEVVLSGWGTTTYPGVVPNKLQTINLMSITVEKCKDIHARYVVTEKHICTLTRAGEGACHGDSGGPLVYNGNQVGVVSWAIPCARGRPDVFTRVYSYLDWIEDITKA